MRDYEEEPQTRNDCVQCNAVPAHEFFAVVDVGDKTYQMRAVLCPIHERQAALHMDALKDRGVSA